MQDIKNAAVPYNTVGLLELRWDSISSDVLCVIITYIYLLLFFLSNEFNILHLTWMFLRNYSLNFFPSCIISIVIFMFGMMRLSAKTPSKNQEKEDENV